MTDTMLFGILKMPFQMAMSDEISRLQYYARVQELVGRFEAQQQAEPVADGDKVICPACCHQFRAIPETVQTLMLHAGFEPPFTTAPKQQAEPMKAADEFDLRQLLAEERYKVRQLSRALREQVESPTFLGEPLITHPAQPEQQAEPVAETTHDYRFRYDKACYKCKSMYCPADCKDTTPPQCKELSASEILNMMPSAIPAEYDGELMEFARAVEAKLKERNGY